MVFLTKLLPTSIVDRISGIIGVSSGMDDFKGRGSMAARLPGIENK